MSTTEGHNGASLKRVVRRLAIRWTCSDYESHSHRWKWTAWLCGRLQSVRYNWKKASCEMIKWRAELKRDGEWCIWISSYLYAPLFWAITAAFCVWYAVNPPNNQVQRAADHE